MVRKKVYTQDQILNAAKELVTNKGFSAITARSVAEQMSISTQPIYLEFKNMEDLKQTLVQFIHSELVNQFFSKERTGEPFVDWALNFISFAKKDKRLFLSLFIEDHDYGTEFRELSFEFIKKAAKNDSKYNKLTEQKLKDIHIHMWIFATGFASLSFSGIIQFDENETTELIQKEVQKEFL